MAADLVLDAFDVTLGLTLIGFAALLLTTRDRFEAIVLFIVFGLLMAMTWGRLDAVDIALAEAAIGAGLTGAMLLGANAALEAQRHRAPADRRAGGAEGRRPGVRLGLALLAAATAATLAVAMFLAPTDVEGLRPLVLEHLADTGVTNPVTAVLLNVRVYDTLLEIAVLLLGVVAIFALGAPPPPPAATPAGPVLLGAVRLLLPVTVLVAGYLLWRGAHAPGGAFQAAAVLAGAGVLWSLAQRRLPARWGGLPMRAALTAGTLALVAAGLAALPRAEPLWTYRGERAHAITIAVEIVATVAISLALLALYTARAPAREEEPR
jgi:multisubunit Na+/H+ antiporter MnhB subunit